MNDHIIVWRAKPGAAVRTYGTGDELTTMVVDESYGSALEKVDAATLTELVSSRAPFEKVSVTTEVARTILGWEV